VATHNLRSSCWSAINGSVYDLTSWIPNHPGGERAILSLCGTDGSDAYNGQHGGSSRTATILGGFKLGALIN
jgi:cytochrome b involved in lipid metabolism